MKYLAALLALAAVSFVWLAGEARGGDKGTVIELDGLKSKTPANWVREKPASNLRHAQFRILKEKDEKYDGEMIIFHFPGGQGGGVNENLERWKKMFYPPKGKTIEEVAKVEKFKVSEVPTTMLDIHGTFKFKKTPMTPDNQAELRPEHRMLAVYFDSKNGPYFIRFIGPEKTVEQNRKGFEDWVKGFK
jgi:hypothetical protein